MSLASGPDRVPVPCACLVVLDGWGLAEPSAGNAVSLARFGLEHAVDHLSTGGGATLELVEGRALPGVEALDGAGVAR